MEPDRVFGDVAFLYDRRRPGYPEAMVDTVLAAAPDAPWRVVECGAGTGKATELFAARGASVVAIEPDARMAERCRRNTARSTPGRVEVMVARFENAELEPAGFTIGLAAQSWHWVDPERGAAQMASALRPGGVLALTWNAPAPDRSPVRLAIEAAYARHVPEMVEGSIANRARPVDESQYQVLLGPDRFAEPERHQFPWSRQYTSAEYAQLLETHSDHRSLPEDRRAALLADVVAVIDDHGGILEYHYETDLRLLRRA